MDSSERKGERERINHIIASIVNHENNTSTQLLTTLSSKT